MATLSVTAPRLRRAGRRVGLMRPVMGSRGRVSKEQLDVERRRGAYDIESEKGKQLIISKPVTLK